MNCREFEGDIPSFIAGELPDEKYDSFIKHLNQCNECKEELEILYLVHNTINSDEADDFSFNLKEKLNAHMKNMEDMVYKRYKYNFFKNSVIIMAEAAAYGIAAWFIIRIINIFN